MGKFEALPTKNRTTSHLSTEYTAASVLFEMAAESRVALFSRGEDWDPVTIALGMMPWSNMVMQGVVG
jgi:hypothetical protein